MCVSSVLSEVGMPSCLGMGNGLLLSLHSNLAVLATQREVGCVCELAGLMHLHRYSLSEATHVLPAVTGTVADRQPV